MRRSDGTLPGLREQLSWPSERPFRILSIDGGGIRGIFPAAILAELEEQYLGGNCIGDQFDLIAGTSTGGIIALALSIGIPASVILNLYMKHGGEIFPERSNIWGLRSARFLWELGHYRYRREPLEKLLAGIFVDRIFGEARRRLCIPAFDGFTEVHVFKTPHHPDFKKDWSEKMLTVALATAAAPTFFPVYADSARHFGDGGVWANNPSMIGLVDALSCYGINRRDVHIISLGCGDCDLKMTKNQIARGGIWHWKNIISSAMHLQSQNATGQAGLLVGRDQLIRLNAVMPINDAIEMDDYRRAHDELPDIAVRQVAEFGELIRAKFLWGAADPYQAFYGPRLSS